MAAIPAVPPARPLRVLYTDDMAALRDLFTIVLTRAGHTAETANDGLHALERLALAPGFDLLITDHHMPRLNGLELVTRLREDNHPARIIVFSSELDPAVHDRYVALGVDAVLPKPIFPSTLLSVLGSLFPPAPSTAR
jgi:CheY-like chemotaxis protein